MKTDTSAGDAANEVFQVDWDALEATINEKTRVLVLNSPHNPTGKMFSRAELEKLAGIVEKVRLLRVSLCIWFTLLLRSANVSSQNNSTPT